MYYWRDWLVLSILLLGKNSWRCQMGKIKKELFDDKRILYALLIFTTYMLACKAASDIGDKYFPKERYMSGDFFGWRPK